MNYYFKVIEQTSVWESILETFTNVDVYYTHEYSSLFAKIEKGQLLAAFYKDDISKIFYPFIKRKVEWANADSYDIVTPYGYGGPLLEGDRESIQSFYNYFAEYCMENKIITETIRFHPIIQNYEVCKKIMDVDYIRKTTGVDLTAPINQIRKQYTSMARRNIKKAENAGLFCYQAESTPKNIRIFIEMYKETMARNKADNYYYFSEEYFFQQMNKSKNSETFLLFVQSECEVIAGVIVMMGAKYSHYHLGASKTSSLHLKPNNLLFDYMIEFCKSKGSTILHLGGGYQENDSLFKFKSSFSNANHFDYYVGKKVYDDQIYNNIAEEVERSYKVNRGYFPIYRGIKELRANSPT